jgi:hypothetical protein
VRIVFPNVQKHGGRMRLSNLVQSRTLAGVAVEELQLWRARLVKTRHQMAAVHAEREGVFSTQHWA